MNRAIANTPASAANVESPALSPRDLGEILAQFNEATGRLSSAHDALRGEVARLESELQESRKKLRRAEQLAALGELAAGIAHEVRNPLGSIRLYARVLVEDLADRPEARGTAEKIVGAVDRLNAVVGDVLSFSREMEPRLRASDLGELVDQAMEACAVFAAEHGVELVRHPSIDGVEVVCDSNLLVQALINVVRNACEAVAEANPQTSRRVRVSVDRRGELDSSGRRREMLVIVVRDSGPGVPPDALPRVFNPFFTTRHTGTGLGLAIVHRILDAHGGGVSIRNAAESRRARRGSKPASVDDPSLPGAIVELLIPCPVVEHIPSTRSLSEVEAA